MSLADLIAEQAARPKSRRCNVCDWVATLNDKDRASLDTGLTAVRENRMTRSSLHRACADYGLEVGDTSFRRHANECSGA